MSVDKYYAEKGDLLPLVPYAPDLVPGGAAERSMLSNYYAYFDNATRGVDRLPPTAAYIGGLRDDVRDRMSHAAKEKAYVPRPVSLGGPYLTSSEKVFNDFEEILGYDPDDRIDRFMTSHHLPSYEVFARSRVGGHDPLNTALMEIAFQRIADEYKNDYEVEDDIPTLRIVKVPHVVKTPTGDFAVARAKLHGLKLRGANDTVELKGRMTSVVPLHSEHISETEREAFRVLGAEAVHRVNKADDIVLETFRGRVENSLRRSSLAQPLAHTAIELHYLTRSPNTN